MNREMVDKLARALLYEGYILYPYRPSLKNRQRWTFGGLYPKSWSDAQEGTDAWLMRTQCLVIGGEKTTLSIHVRFLHLVDRTVAQFPGSQTEAPAFREAEFDPVASLKIDGKEYQPWQEAEERHADLGEFDLADLLARPRETALNYPYRREIEYLRGANGAVVGLLAREQRAIDALVEVSASTVGENLHRITVNLFNRTTMAKATDSTRDDALMRSLVSTHTILGVASGEFVSLTDPPERWNDLPRECKNIGTWPVLVGNETERDTILSSPIILSDYPQLAPESPGDLFDSTEIDEILTLRIMTLTDDEKRSAADTDDRVRQLLARTDALARDQLMGLHGALRGLRPV